MTTGLNVTKGVGGGTMMSIDELIRAIVDATVAMERAAVEGTEVVWIDLSAAMELDQFASSHGCIRVSDVLREARGAVQSLPSELGELRQELCDAFVLAREAPWHDNPGPEAANLRDTAKQFVARLAADRWKPTDDVFAAAVAFARALVHFYNAQFYGGRGAMMLLKRATNWLAAVMGLAHAIHEWQKASGRGVQGVDELERTGRSLTKVLVRVLYPVTHMALAPNFPAARKAMRSPSQFPVSAFGRARLEAQKQIVEMVAQAGSDPIEADALSVAEALCRYGLIPAFMRVVESAHAQGRTVWLLGRDCDALYILARNKYQNVRYLHGYNRRFVADHNDMALRIAKGMVKAGDVVVDTGFAGSCLAPFKEAGATGVLLSSNADARSKYIALDEMLDQEDHLKARDAILKLEYLGGFDSSRRATRVVIGDDCVPREVIDDDRKAAHAAFIRAFVRACEHFLQNGTIPSAANQQVQEG